MFVNRRGAGAALGCGLGDGHLRNTLSVEIHRVFLKKPFDADVEHVPRRSPATATAFSPRDTLMKFKNVNSNLIQICELWGLVHIYYAAGTVRRNMFIQKRTLLFENLN